MPYIVCSLRIPLKRRLFSDSIPVHRENDGVWTNGCVFQISSTSYAMHSENQNKVQHLAQLHPYINNAPQIVGYSQWNALPAP